MCSLPVSYSGITMYNNCPSSFKRKYILGEAQGAPATRETAPAMFRGTDLHEAVESLLKGEINQLPKEIGMYNDFCVGLRTQGALPEVEFAFNEEWELVDFDDPTARIRGFLDAKLCTEEQLIVYEWKTGKVYDEHVFQRNLYGLAALLMHPEHKKVRVITTYLDQKMNKETTYTSDMVKSYKWMWDRSINKTQPPQPYPMRPGWKCRWCSFSKRSGGKCPN